MLFFGIKLDAFTKLKITSFRNFCVICKSLRKNSETKIKIFRGPRVSLCVSGLTADHYCLVFWGCSWLFRGCSGVLWDIPRVFWGVPGFTDTQKKGHCLEDTAFFNENFQIAACDHLQNQQCMQISKTADAMKFKIHNSKLSFSFRMI